jgi:hypothetical protein
MPLNHLLLFSAVWWVFATIVAFLAAVLFWNKGAAQLSGQPPGMATLKVGLTGAGAIWGFTLLVFYFINPLRGYSDAKVLLVQIDRAPVAGELFESGINVDQLPKGIDLNKKGVVVELINKRLSPTLSLDANNQNHLVPDFPVPAGRYEIRITDTEGNTTSSPFHVDVPESPPQVAKKGA